MLHSFESWVRRRFGLAICILRQDNDTGTLAIRGKTEYELWCEGEGITIETPPLHTHGPTGGAERAGKEIITKALDMRLAANLPEFLWDECALAAIFLFNKSPRHRSQMCSPDEVLERWFAQYFR